MRLLDAAKFFDRNTVNDGYTGAYLFKGQLNLYDDTRRDSEASERRVLSVAAGTSAPPRRVVELGGYRYILGKANPDLFRGSVIRLGYVAQEAPVLARVRTLEESCLNAGGFQAWSNQAWLKNSAFTEQSAELAPQFHLFFSVTENIEVNQVIEYGGEVHLVRTFNTGASGIKVVTTEQIAAPQFETAAFVKGYDPVSGLFSGATHSARVLRLRWQSLFEYGEKSTPPFGPDDIQLVVAKVSYTPEPGAQLTLSDRGYKVSGVREHGNVWVCRCTRVNG